MEQNPPPLLPQQPSPIQLQTPETKKKKAWLVIAVIVVCFTALAAVWRFSGDFRNGGLPAEALLAAEKAAHLDSDSLTAEKGNVRDLKVAKVYRPELTPADAANGVTDTRIVDFTWLYRDNSGQWADKQYSVMVRLVHGKWEHVAAYDMINLGPHLKLGPQ